ncbi:MAG: putative T7SS-secreted protein, partial [Streptomyces sp.]
SYADTVKWAQDQAQEAIEKYRKGEDASDKAKKADDPPDKDPGDADRDRAHEILDEARRQRNTAAEAAERAVRAALAHAPAEPPPLDRAGALIMDGYGAGAVELNHVVGGVVKGTAGIVNFARGLNPTDPYNLTHPAEYYQNVNMTLSGLVSTAAHPERIPQALAETFKKDFSEGVGRLIPEIFGTKGAGTVRTGLRVGAREGVEAGVESAARRPGSHIPDPPKDWSDLAESTKHVNEKAIHADSISPEKAREFIDDQYPWLNDVNNTGQPGYVDNCSHNVVTVDKRLDGHEVSAAPRAEGAHIPPEALGLKNRGLGQYDSVKSYDELIQNMNSRGEGARSVVYVSRADGSAHVFNAVNTKHGVVFLDGQSGTLGKLERDVTSIQHIPYR